MDDYETLQMMNKFMNTKDRINLLVQLVSPLQLSDHLLAV